MNMGRVLFIVFIFSLPVMVSCHLFAQSGMDSLLQKSDQPTYTNDSTRALVQNKVNSVVNLTHQFTHLPDSLTPALSKCNRILDSIKRNLTRRIDSLTRLNLPTGQYTHLV